MCCIIATGNKVKHKLQQFWVSVLAVKLWIWRIVQLVSTCTNSLVSKEQSAHDFFPLSQSPSPWQWQRGCWWLQIWWDFQYGGFHSKFKDSWSWRKKSSSSILRGCPIWHLLDSRWVWHCHGHMPCDRRTGRSFLGWVERALQPKTPNPWDSNSCCCMTWICEEQNCNYQSLLGGWYVVDEEFY